MRGRRFTSRESFHRLALLAVWMLCPGCASQPKQVVPKDAALIRQVSAGREAFDEGDLQEAEKKYRRALIRAWAIDDPYESGTMAYNLAACLTARSQWEQAENWLIDARVELCRAQSSAGNTWLLSAEIAMAQHCFETAERYVNYASLACPPCEIDEANCLCGPAGDCRSEECDECCLVRIPCVGKKIRDKQSDRDCQQGYQARVELTRAKLAAKQFDVGGATRHLALASELAAEVCDLSLQADRHDVAALIHDAQANFLQAGAHRDREVKLLRCIGMYREIPDVLDAAAESYCSAERLDLAIDRIIRSARIRLARGQLEQAWQRIRDAAELVQWNDCEAVEIRLGLTAKLIEDALVDAKRNAPCPPPVDPPSVDPPPIDSAPIDPPASESVLGDFLSLE
ncbi:hypothetical protein NHH03_09950 [Stieleria sp. TO1_6]|uniref:hypothetical protein n=1 Tax=Stieleria tagensis TaxID=2956795 RepID=UPI00209B29E3|nr:hypothetical protein [Stieleria tagensis]MCO8122060.1 hypothetical protein [Stieleria tagensis]